MKNLFKLLIGLSLFYGAQVFASATVGEWAQSLMGPAKGLMDIINALCYLTGGVFFVGAIIRYRNHRKNPQQVRLSTPIFYLILAIVIILIPILAMLGNQ